MKNRLSALTALVASFILFIQMPGMNGFVAFAETISMDTEITADTDEYYDVYGGTLTIAEGVSVTGNIYASGGAIVNSGEISRVTGISATSSLTNNETGHVADVGYEGSSGAEGNITNDGTIDNIYCPSGTIVNGGTITNVEDAVGTLENNGTITSLSNLDAEVTNTGTIGTVTMESGVLRNSGNITSLTVNPDLSDSVETLVYLNGGSVVKMETGGTVPIEVSSMTTLGTMSGTYMISGAGSLKVTENLAVVGSYSGTVIEVLDSTQIVIASGTSVDVTYDGKVYTLKEAGSGTLRSMAGTTVSALVLDSDTIDTASGSGFSQSKNYLAGETISATYTAAEGYYFPSGYKAESNGSGTITTTIKNDTVINVSYTLGDDESGTVTITIPAAVEKEEIPEEKPDETPTEPVEAPTPGYYVTGTKGENDYYVSDVRINAPTGYLISDSENGTYGAGLNLNGNRQPEKIYLKRISDGAKTKPVAFKTILIDAKAPEIKAEETVYYAEMAEITISDENLQTVYVNGIPLMPDDVSCVIQITSDNSSKEYEIRAVDKAGNSTVVNLKIAAEWMKDGIVPGGESVNLLTGNAYKLGSGSWKVDGDETTYNGNNTFYVNEEGSYRFEEQ